MKQCTIPGCQRQHKAHGYCSRHYDVWRNSGDPLMRQRRERGTGSISHGYVRIQHDGKLRHAHTIIAEAALGKPLPVGAVVHHVNEDRLDNRCSNLVVCPDQEYHLLLHRRMRAMAACGNPNWMKCRRCGVYDDPAQMKVYGRAAFHAECERAYYHRRRVK